MMIQGIDVIGDIHGCVKSLVKLLEQLGYTKQLGVYQHATRKVLFLGDIIDRGPGIRDALHIVKDMVDAGYADIILGNHEYNALAYTTRVNRKDDEKDVFLRVHSPHNNKLIAETLFQFAAYPLEWSAFLAWFQEIPFFIETPLFRAVHACWDAELIYRMRQNYASICATPQFLQDASVSHSLAGSISDRLLRGVNIAIPGGQHLFSKEGYQRRTFRAKFWVKPTAQMQYKDVVFQPDRLPDEILSQQLDSRVFEQFVSYGEDEQPLFLGHYWLKGNPAVLADNIACLDYSAIIKGRLMAYRFDGEKQLDVDKFVWVDGID